MNRFRYVTARTSYIAHRFRRCPLALRSLPVSLYVRLQPSHYHDTLFCQTTQGQYAHELRVGCQKWKRGLDRGAEHGGRRVHTERTSSVSCVRFPSSLLGATAPTSTYKASSLAPPAYRTGAVNTAGQEPLLFLTCIFGWAEARLQCARCKSGCNPVCAGFGIFCCSPRARRRKRWEPVFSNCMVPAVQITESILHFLMRCSACES